MLPNWRLKAKKQPKSRRMNDILLDQCNNDDSTNFDSNTKWLFR